MLPDRNLSNSFANKNGEIRVISLANQMAKAQKLHYVRRQDSIARFKCLPLFWVCFVLTFRSVFAHFCSAQTLETNEKSSVDLMTETFGVRRTYSVRAYLGFGLIQEASTQFQRYVFDLGWLRKQALWNSLLFPPKQIQTQIHKHTQISSIEIECVSLTTTQSLSFQVHSDIFIRACVRVCTYKMSNVNFH